MFIVAFLTFLALIALYCAFLSHRAWRDPDNWYVDPQSKQVSFHNWAEFGLSDVMALACSAMVVPGLIL